ncbi:lysophospholipid acyltransferase family protein (DUF374 domain) [Arcobacter venerupis]|uniref:Lysophospholipid acyltransferase family protein (DUF374 domain) n=1 Tax=Arcobacter venerupis TaxID=1054033 RepID=A0AAE7B8X5_9BACT|nr:lysophospholipid acyltransferase family protein [Arcobacter venerupis]QKF65957.1 lysophospholipid acyltransferase family protein (DUF374 domain) [Arcobacter venerupis]RWS49317.1 hypothetical protein CKA56_09640 [Arcobacter venerupis]
MKNYFKFKVLPYLLYLLINFLYFTNKKVFHHPKLKDDEAFIFVAWHGDLVSQPLNYFNKRPNGTVKTMISQSKDGEIITKVYSLFGIGAIRGSSSKGATKALISTIKEIKSGSDVAISPDGPRGPRHSFAGGVISIAQKSGAKIVILSSKPTKYWQFNSWDRFVLPKPFGRVDFYMSEPLDVTNLEFEEARDFVRNKMLLNIVS